MRYGEWGLHGTPEQRFWRYLEVDHHIVYEMWGAIQVSKEASLAYGITPIQPIEDKGPLRREVPHNDTTGIGVNIALLGPCEARHIPASETDSGLTVGIIGLLGEDSINLAVRFGENRHEALETFIEDQEADTGDVQPVGMSSNAGTPPNAHRIPVSEAYFHDLPQIYVREFTRAVRTHVIKSVEEILSTQEHSQVLRRQVILDRIGMLGVGGMLVGSNFAGRGIAGGALAAIGFGSYIGSKYALREALQCYFESQPRFAEEHRFMASALGEQVATSIQNVYGRAHFDAAAESGLTGLQDE